MDREFAAHLRDDGAVQTIEEHCRGTAALAAEFAEAPFRAAAEYVGMTHDVGKYRDGFQRRIYGESTRPCEHACAGAQEIARRARSGGKMFGMLSFMFEYCVAGHHAGLQNGKACESVGGTLSDALKRDVSDIDVYRPLFEGLSVPPEENELADIVKMFCTRSPQDITESYAFFTRYLFSCLTDADFIDTERFCDQTAQRGIAGDFAAALERVNAALAKMPEGNAVCAARRALQAQAFEAADDSCISTLEMPTGSGKTLCSIKLALERAVRGKKRIIYVIPYTSIIEQTAQKFEEIFGDVLPVMQHHHNYSPDMAQGDPEVLRRSTENWDAPLIVTTNVQFFESLYHNKSSRLRKLHSMAQSVIVFDEVHMMPVEFLQPCLRGVGLVTQALGAQAVFMSATMPDFSELIARYTTVEKPRELITDKRLFGAFRNCACRDLGELSGEQLLELAGAHESSLIILNSRRRARKLYEQCTGRRFYLSTYMTPKHRSRTIAQIRGLLGRERLTVISTSLVEAGVDLDFEAVFRETAGLDSVIQSAGRCNREGRRAQGFMYVFESEGAATPRSLKMKAEICRALLKEYEDIFSQECVREYYRRLYMMNESAIECATIYRDGMKPDSIPFADYAERFRLIESDSVNVVIPDGENAEDVAALEYGGRSVYRRLARSCASLHYNELEKLAQQGVVAQRGGAYVLQMAEYYDENTGLDPEHQFDAIFT